MRRISVGVSGKLLPGASGGWKKAWSKKWVQETGPNLFPLWLGVGVLSRQLENDERRGDAEEVQCFVQ